MEDAERNSEKPDVPVVDNIVQDGLGVVLPECISYVLKKDSITSDVLSKKKLQRRE